MQCRFSKALAISLSVFLTFLAYSIYRYSTCESEIILIYSSFLSVLVAFVVFLVSGRLVEQVTSAMFALVLFVSCVSFSLIFPPATVPDEGHHYLASYWIADCIQDEASLTDSISFPVRTADWEMLSRSSTEITLSSYGTVRDNFELFNASGSVFDVQNTFSIGAENVIVRIGSVTAILIGKSLNLGAYPMFYLGRIFNSLLYIVLVTGAFRVIPFAKNVIVCVALLPMALHLAASYSYDSGIIGLAILLAALLLKSLYENAPFTRVELISIGACLIAIAPCKLIYIPIILLLLLIPSNKFRRLRNKVIVFVILVSFAIAAVMIFRLAGVVSLATSSSSLDYRGMESGTFYSLGDLIADPIGTFLLFARTTFINMGFYLRSMIGGSLGWFQDNLQAPSILILLYFCVLYASVQKDRDDSTNLSISTKLVFAAIFISCYIGAMLSMCLGWTFNTETVIQGMQGRYLLPVLPLGALICRLNCLTIKCSLRCIILLFMIGLNSIYSVGILASVA